MSAESKSAAGESEIRISPWWLLVAAVATGAALTAIAALLPGSPALDDLSSVEWLGSTATIAALVVAVGIYRLQERSSSEAHTELMEQLEAQSELLHEYAEGETGEADEHDPLTPDQRAAIEERFGRDSIAAAIDPGVARGNRARLVRMKDGQLVSVFSGGRTGRTRVRQVDARRRRDANRRRMSGGDEG